MINQRRKNVWNCIKLFNFSRLWNKRSPWNNHSPPLKNFHITILILFYINLGIGFIFWLFFLQNLSKINKQIPIFIPEFRVKAWKFQRDSLYTFLSSQMHYTYIPALYHLQIVISNDISGSWSTGSAMAKCDFYIVWHATITVAIR